MEEREKVNTSEGSWRRHPKSEKNRREDGVIVEKKRDDMEKEEAEG